MNLKPEMQFRQGKHILTIKKVNPDTIEYMDSLDDKFDKRESSRISWEIGVEVGDLIPMNQADGDNWSPGETTMDTNTITKPVTVELNPKAVAKPEVKAGPKPNVTSKGKDVPKAKVDVKGKAEVKAKDAKPKVERKRREKGLCSESVFKIGDIVEYIGRTAEKKGQKAEITGQRDEFGFKLKYLADGSTGTTTVHGIKFLKHGEPKKAEVKKAEAKKPEAKKPEPKKATAPKSKAAPAQPAA